MQYFLCPRCQFKSPANKHICQTCGYKLPSAKSSQEQSGGTDGGAKAKAFSKLFKLDSAKGKDVQPEASG